MGKLFGITGGIGSGKSTITGELLRCGYPVYDTDKQAQLIMHHNRCVRAGIELLFGSEIYIDDKLDKQRVAELVFHDKTLLKKLNDTVHPAVAYELKEWAERQSGVCFVESAILFESGISNLCQAVIGVYAPTELRIRRVVERDHTTAPKAQARIRNQMSNEQLQEKADLMVSNDGTQSVSALCDIIINFCKDQAKQ